MLTLDDGQRQIASRARAQLVTLVKLDTFTDHAAQTIDETFWWASVPIRYKWDGSTVEQFKGFLRGVSPISRGFPHIPDPTQLSTRDGLTIDLDASTWADQFPWQRLIAKNLIGAHIEVASLLVDLGDPLPDDWKDQSGLGAIHTVRFRGEVTDVPEYDDEANVFSITCDSIEVPLPWAVALDPLEVSAKDLGKVYPIPVGLAKRVPLVQRQVGWVTTLGNDITELTTGLVFVSDTTGFPDAPDIISLFIGTEKLTATKNSANSLIIVARGQSSGVISTAAQNHKTGAVVIEELPVAKFVYSGVENMGITALYARSPQSGELIRIPSGSYGMVPSDKDVDIGIALGVVSFTSQLWGKLIRLLNNEASITTQPVFVQSSDIRSEVPARTNIFNKGVGDGDGILISGTDIRIVFVPAQHEAAAFHWLAGDLSSTTDVVVRVRAIFDYTIKSDATAVTRYIIGFDNGFLGLNVTIHTAGINAGAPDSTRNIVTAWFDCPPGTTVADALQGASFNAGSPLILVVPSTGSGGSGSQIDVPRAAFRIEMELPSNISQTQLTATTGAQEIGFNLDLFADVQGAVTLGVETSETTMDDDTGWTGINANISSVGAPGEGLIIAGDGTGIIRVGFKTGLSLDFSASRFKFDYSLTQLQWDIFEFGNTAFRVTMLSSGGNWIEWSWPKSVLMPVDWHEFTFDPNGSAVQITAFDGTLDKSSVVQINITWLARFSSNAGAISIRDHRSEARTLNTHPIDVAQWLIEENAGITDGADSSSFATAKTNLPSVTFAGDLRQAGMNLGEVLARIGFESRTNFLPSEAPGATVFKAFNALATYAFTASSRTLSEFNSLRTKTKMLDEQTTEFVGLFDFRNQFDQTDVQGYAALIQANETTNDVSADVPTVDITDAQDRVGIRASIPLMFFLLPGVGSMIEVFAYYVQESLRGASIRYTMQVPYSLGYDLEPGDVIEFTPRWKTSPVKCRILRVNYPFDEPIVGINLEEIL